MSTKTPREPGGFAYGELHASEPAIQESGTRGRDAPLSKRGRRIWVGIVSGLLVASAILVIAVLATGE